MFQFLCKSTWHLFRTNGNVKLQRKLIGSIIQADIKQVTGKAPL